MPNLFGIQVSPDVAELNSHLTTQAKQPKRTAVRTWKNEREFQAAVFEAVGWEAKQHPGMEKLFHIANENSHKQPGVKAGVPDLCLPLARGRYHGLFIELKITGGKLSQAQSDVISDLRLDGYAAHVVWDSVDQVIGIIIDYMKGRS